MIARFAFLSRHIDFHSLFIDSFGTHSFRIFQSNVLNSISHLSFSPLLTNLPARDLTRVHDQFSTILLLRSLGEHLHHALARILDRERRVVTHAHSLCGPITQRCRHMARVDGEAVEPFVFRVDADRVPVDCRFGRRIRSIGDGEVIAVTRLVNLTHSKMTYRANERKSDSHQQARRRSHGQKYGLARRLLQ